MFRRTIVTVMFIISITACFAQQSPEMEKLTYARLKGQFRNLVKGPIKAAKIDTLKLLKENAVFTFTGGTFFVCPEINGNIHALVYKGKGNFSFTPPGDVEQMQLFRFYEKKSLDENFNFLFLLFTDSTYNEIENKFDFGLIQEAENYTWIVKDALKFLFDNDDEYLNENIVYTFLEGKTDDYFFSYFNDNNNDPMFYENDPSDEENIHLMRKYKTRFRDWLEIVSQFPSGQNNNSGIDNSLVNGEIKISQYKINSSISDDLDFSAAADLTFTSNYDNQNTILLYLYDELDVDSIQWSDGTKAVYYREDESSPLWIIPAEPLIKKQDYGLRIYYHGDLLERDELGWISMKSSILWYPGCINRQKSLFDLTFTVSERYKFCSIGDITSTLKNGEDIVTRWQTQTPVRNASFNIGVYEEYKIEKKDLASVTVLMSESGHNQIGSTLASMGILSSGNMQEKLGADVINSMNLYKHLYGEIPLKNLYVTETPYFHGLAFPGLIHLSWTAFQGIDDEGGVEHFIAHEVAHQWWGIQVDFNNYHDQWLSEGFSDFSALQYVQAVNGNEIFFDMLDDWKEDIMSNRKYLFGSGQEAGPVSLGFRTNSSDTRGDYGLIIYKKGAWILHMLRNMLLDVKTMKEDKFENMMREFYTSFKGKKASTKDFQKIVEKYFGEKMDWFFNQWVYGTGIPEYKFAYKTETLPDGKFKVRCRVNQENVADNFKMYVNLLLKFEGDRYIRLKVEVKGNQSEFDLPLLPAEPEEITFNDLHSVLCDVEYEDW